MTEIIPAIDIKGGNCVRLLHGNFAKETVYSADPVEVARRFAQAGIKRLHMVDLDGARGGSPVHLDILRCVTAETPLEVDFSGGVRLIEDVRAVIEAGAVIVTVGSLAVTSPDTVGEWISEFGTERFLIGVDMTGGKAAVNGWTETTTATIDAVLDGLVRRGATRFFVTDIAKDGAMQGPATELYRRLTKTYPQIDITASGGVRNLDDVAALGEAGCTGVIVGRAIYEGAISIEETSRYAR